MKFTERGMYHIYNRGNNKQRIFFNDDNYVHFLKKVRKELLPHCGLLAYSLMPNHFHFLAQIKPMIHQLFKQIDIKESSSQKGSITVRTERHPLSYSIGILLSSYSQAINKQNGTSGSLFQQRTKAKYLDNVELVRTVLHYIHQNPVRAGLVQKMEDWAFSSFRDYTGFRNGTLIDQELVFDLLQLTKENFYFESYKAIDERRLANIF